MTSEDANKLLLITQQDTASAPELPSVARGGKGGAP